MSVPVLQEMVYNVTSHSKFNNGLMSTTDAPDFGRTTAAPVGLTSSHFRTNPGLANIFGQFGICWISAQL